MAIAASLHSVVTIEEGCDLGGGKSRERLVFRHELTSALSWRRGLIYRKNWHPNETTAMANGIVITKAAHCQSI